MKIPPWLLQALRGRKRPATAPRQGLDNPYHRFFTQDRSFEQLARQGREAQKQQDHNQK